MHRYHMLCSLASRGLRRWTLLLSFCDQVFGEFPQQFLILLITLIRSGLIHKTPLARFLGTSTALFREPDYQTRSWRGRLSMKSISPSVSIEYCLGSS